MEQATAASYRVYVETSVISVLAARPSQETILAARQLATHRWWNVDALTLQLFASPLVHDESERGDREMSEARLLILSKLQMLEITDAVVDLADELMRSGIFPAKAADDVLHIAIAAMHNMDYLVTWNCKHLANAHIRRQVERFLRTRGYNIPGICTPDELTGVE